MEGLMTSPRNCKNINMKNLFFLLIILSALFTSCEDPIDVTLIEAEPLLVVDAWLNDIDDTQVIKLTSSQAYFDNTPAIGITNAEVSVTRDDGEIFEFSHTSNGTYTHTLDVDASIGEIGNSFTLNINVDSKDYAATTILNRSAPIDSIRQEFRENEVFGDDGIYCELMSRDPVGFGDTYWIKAYKNGEYLNRASEINIAYDAGFDSGGEIDGFIFITPIRELINPLNDELTPTPWVAGDNIRVEIHSMSEDNFYYMETFRDQLINSQSGIFAEPLANTKGIVKHVNGEDTVLGTFNVASVSVIDYVIK
jgi:hypothetical protein